MKQMTNRLHFSTRTLAMVLSIVMLIGSIATGSMLSTFAAYLKDNVNNDAVSQAATEGGAIALNAITDKGSDEAVDAAPADDDTPEVIDGIVVNEDYEKNLASKEKAEALADFEENDIAKSFKKDLAGTGASVDIAASGYDLQHDARVYFNAYGRGSGAGSDNNVKKYVYMAILFKGGSNPNDAGGNYYQIVKMDHIANTELYTCYTSSANTNTATNAHKILFFSSDSSGWACKSSSEYGNARDNISANCGGFCSNTYGENLYTSHVYYYTIDDNYNLTLDDKNGSSNVANSDSVTNLKAGTQKASVYVSSDGASYSYAGNSSGDNTTKGGDVVVGGYGWSTAYEATDKLFATSSKNNGTDSYSQFEKPVLTTWITMKVNEVYDGYHFMGWYYDEDNDGTVEDDECVESSTTYYYQLSTNNLRDVHARFLKPEYSIATPASANTISKKIIVKKNSGVPENLYIWNTSGDNSTNWDDTSKKLTQQNGSDYYTYSMSSTNNPTAIVRKSDKGKLSGDMTPKSNTTYTDNVYYWELADNETNDQWNTFTHLGTTGLTVDKTSAQIGEEVTLTATAPSTGTLKSGVTYSYYYTTDDSTWYQISAGGTNTTQKFYPPANGVYTYKVTVTDSAGLETVVATASDTTTVGVLSGKYLAGSATLFGGSDWDTAQDKGLMTETSTADVYTKTFGNVAAGTYQFRVTTLEDDGTVTWETDYDDEISGTASPTHVKANESSEHADNIQFVLTENKKVTFTYNDSTKAVTVDVEDVQAIDVVVYAGTGGSVEVTYGTAVTTIEENDNATIKVAYGDSIDLETTPEGGYIFAKWYKNLVNDYRGTPEKADGYDSLENEVITQRTVYTACFSAGAGDTGFDSSTYTTAGTDFSIKYSTGNNSEYQGSNGTALSGTVWRSGSIDYYIELTSAELETWKTALSSGQVRWNLFNNNTNTQITDKNGYDVSYYDPGTSALKNCEDGGDSTLLIKSKPDDYSSNVFIELSKIDSTVGSLGIHINTSNKKVDYYFGASGGGTVTPDYIPSTNYYAKDSSIRDGNYNYWIYPTKTTVTAVEGQVSVAHDHTDGHHWVDGFALKGSEITVTTVVPNRGRYKSVDRNGNTTTDQSTGDNPGLRADEKYYVAGFSFNGVTPELISESSGVAADYIVDGTNYGGTAYSCTYKIPTDMKESMLEITPIIFVKDAYASETVMVYINGYNDEVKNAGWGNTLYLYPFYKSNSATYAGQGENFGRYPGQPIINYGGQMFCQIPLTDDASKNGKDDNGGPVKGITINNGYFDDVHKTYCNHVSVHRQTYDYDDFAKIYNQKKTKNGSKYLYSIYFSFKYFAQNSTQQHRLANTTNGITGDNNASRYNDLLSASGILSNTNGTVSSSTLITAGENSTGWEDLKDSLGNNVDIFGNKVTNASAEPLRVFSLGYEYNNAGRWATEWAVYYKSGENYVLVQDPNKTGAASDKYSMIVPSALIFNDKASLSSAAQLDSDLAINGYDGIYEALEAYRGVPVKICYEHDIPDAFNPKNYRCDGRWTYTTVDDFVRSNIKIEYYDKDGVLLNDTFGENSHVGNTTGCSAYFTNSAYYGATVSDSEIIDNSESYNFTAEAKGSYEFVGWYMYDTAGHESTITKDSLTADTPRSGNFTLAARFKYVASGNLTISNSLATNSVGRANTYLGVTLINGDKQTVVANVNSNTAPVTLDKSYINANSNYQIKIDIRTVPLGENTFKEYTCYTTNGSSGTDVRSAASDTDIYDVTYKTNTTDTYTLSVKGDIFDSTTTNQQNVKAIEYISELNPVHYTYSVKFNYTSRQYGDQAFTQTGELTSGQINDDKVVTGTSGEADKKLTKAFLAKIAPHESNFNEKITWNFDSVVDSQTCTYTSGTNTYNISLNISKANATIDSTSTEFSKVRHGYFTVPYAQTNGVANDDGSGKVAKTAEPTTFTIDVEYDDLFKIGDNFVTAPTIIYETVEGVEHERYFKYWEMSTVSSKRGDSRVVGKCYFPEFNYRALDNYNIKAVYTTDEDPEGTNFTTLYASEANTTSIDFIGNSRNQWNNGDNGTLSDTGSYASGDLIYNDFILSFKPQSDSLFNELESAECGFVIQRLKQIETNSSGANAKTLQEYAKDYSSTDLDNAKNAAATKAGGSDATGYTQIKVSINKNQINDKNRCHYAYSMFNTRNGNVMGGETINGAKVGNAKYLYRAYSYMKIGSGEYILSNEPTYFYMYDIAQQ